MIRILLIAILIAGICPGGTVANAALGETPEKPHERAFTEPRACLKVWVDHECTEDLSRIAAGHYDLREYDRAVMRYTQIITIRDHAQDRTNRGIAYAKLRKYELARIDFLRAHELAPLRDDPWGNLAQLEWRRGNLKMALHYVSRAIEVRRDHDYVLLKAQLLWQLGKKRQAVAERRAADKMRRIHHHTLSNVVVDVDSER